MTAFYDPDAAMDKIQRDIRAAQDRAERAAQMKVSIDRVRGTGRSARGEVVAEVDASGLLRDLELADAAMVLRPDELGQMIRETIARAQRDAGAQAVTIADEAFGSGSEVTEHLRAEIDERFGPMPGPPGRS